MSLVVDTDTCIDRVRLSRGEVELLCNRAARGAGMSWGLAEETGFAVAWLITQSLDGVRLLSRHLDQVQHLSWQDMRPNVQACAWHAERRDNFLCPIALGTSISDYLCVNPGLLHGDGLCLATVSYPGLLLPFIALACDSSTDVICVRSDDTVVYISGHRPLAGDVGDFIRLAHGDLKVSTTCTYPPSSLVSAGADPATIVVDAAVIDGDVVRALNRFAMRTTVPASVVSRANAGAADEDND